MRREKLDAVSRRRLLQSAGIATGSMFLPSLMSDREAYAQTMPRRLIVFYTEHGPVTGKWEFRPAGMPATPQSEWELPLGPLAQTDFTETLRPLHAVRDDVFILEGVALTSAIADKQGNNHGVATAHRFTNAMDGAKHVSFEQMVADKVAVAGRFKSLGFTPNGGDVNNAGFYDTAGNAVTLNRCDNYYGFMGGQFDRVFKNVMTGTTMPAGPPTGAALSAARRQASVGFVQGQFDKLANRLGAEDKAKLLLHKSMLNDLALRVQSFSQITCTKPATPPKGNENNAQVVTILATKMFPYAMACDLTRVGELHCNQLDAVSLGAPSTKDVHQDIAHASGSNGNVGDPQAMQWMTNYYKIHAQHMADMIAAFKSVPEGNGTMLDNSILVHIPELGNGGHDLFRMMITMAGGKNLGLKPGRYIKYAESGANPYNLLNSSPYGSTPGGNYGSVSYGLGPAHSRLLVSIMQAVAGAGAPNEIGLNAAMGTGYMKGVPIPMTGPLPRLAG